MQGVQQLHIIALPAWNKSTARKRLSLPPALASVLALHGQPRPPPGQEGPAAGSTTPVPPFLLAAPLALT